MLSFCVNVNDGKLQMESDCASRPNIHKEYDLVTIRACARNDAHVKMAIWIDSYGRRWLLQHRNE